MQQCNRLHCLGNGIGNVVQFQIKKYRKAELLHFMHAVMSVGTEKFEAQLNPANLVLNAPC